MNVKKVEHDKRVTIRLKGSVRDRLFSESKRRGLKPSEFLRNALERALDTER